MYVNNGSENMNKGGYIIGKEIQGWYIWSLIIEGGITYVFNLTRYFHTNAISFDFDINFADLTIILTIFNEKK